MPEHENVPSTNALDAVHEEIGTEPQNDGAPSLPPDTATPAAEGEPYLLPTADAAAAPSGYQSGTGDKPGDATITVVDEATTLTPEAFAKASGASDLPPGEPVVKAPPPDERHIPVDVPIDIAAQLPLSARVTQAPDTPWLVTSFHTAEGRVQHVVTEIERGWQHLVERVQEVLDH